MLSFVIVIIGFRRCLISFLYPCVDSIVYNFFLFTISYIGILDMSEQNRVIGADYCPFCAKVKNYFQTNKIPFTWIDTETPEGAKVRA